MHKGQNDISAMAFKAHVTEADWLAEGRQESDWAKVMTAELRLI